MPFDFSDHFFPTALSASLNASASDTTVTVDTLSSEFVTAVENSPNPRFPLRLGRGSSQERVVVTGIADANNNQLTVGRNVGEYGLQSHATGTRVAHAVPAWAAGEANLTHKEIAEIWDRLQVLEAALRDLDSRVTANGG